MNDESDEKDERKQMKVLNVRNSLDISSMCVCSSLCCFLFFAVYQIWLRESWNVINAGFNYKFFFIFFFNLISGIVTVLPTSIETPRWL